MAKTGIPMARPREFDIEEVLTTALDVFWAHGYDATSMSDLMEATGLAKGSLYKGYGDKKSLFMRALDSYLSSANAGLSEAAASGESGREALEEIFSGVIGMSTCANAKPVEVEIPAPASAHCVEDERSLWLQHTTKLKKISA